LHSASTKGHARVVRQLAKHDSDTNCMNDHGLKPIQVALENSHFESAWELLKCATPEEVTTSQITVLLESHADRLSSVGCDETKFNAGGNHDKTLLHLAASLGCHQHIKGIMVWPGIDVILRLFWKHRPPLCHRKYGAYWQPSIYRL
jgi:hypothetical protein